MKNFLFFALLMLFCDADVDVFGQYVYIQHGRNWKQAQEYCRENYMDLATITSEEEHQQLTNLTGHWGWIGLHRAATLPMNWQWSDGRLTNFTKWIPGWPYNGNNEERCVRVHSSSWYDDGCFNHYIPFFCQKRIFFMKENKTWDEALEYCRSNYTGLMSLDSVTWLNLAALVTQRVSVWTGLRFLDGKWFWLDGTQDESLDSLPSCPVQPYRCGARNFNNSAWENRDCNEKLYFLCY